MCDSFEELSVDLQDLIPAVRNACRWVVLDVSTDFRIYLMEDAVNDGVESIIFAEGDLLTFRISVRSPSEE